MLDHDMHAAHTAWSHGSECWALIWLGPPTAAKSGEDLEGMMPMRSLAVGVLLREAASEAALDTLCRSTCTPRR